MKFMKTMPSFYLEITLPLFVLFFEMPSEQHAKEVKSSFVPECGKIKILPIYVLLTYI